MLRKYAGWVDVSAAFLDDQWPGMPVQEQLQALGKKFHGESLIGIGAIHQSACMDYKVAIAFWKDDGR